MKGLVDTNILIYLANEQLELSNLFERYDELLISQITYMEVLGFDFQSEEDEELVKLLVSEFRILDIDNRVCESTIEIRKRKKIKLPDAIIYATAIVNTCELVTANVSDFRGLDQGVEIYNPMAE